MWDMHLIQCRTLCCLIALLFLGSCASSKKNFFSKTYHNTTAKFNAYYLAKENIREVETAIADAHDNNFDRILSVFYDIDSATIDGVRDQLDDAIVKASLSIQRHENSKWVYPSYFLVGKARYYGGDFVNAIETFKYVNKNSEEKDVRHHSLVALMRTFIDYNEISNAVAVADHLRKEQLSKENMYDFLLVKTYLYQKVENYDLMVESLSKAIELETVKKNKARQYYILGQLYQHLGFEGEAYHNYKNCLKSNPEYELSFYAKLSIARVTKLDQKVDLKKIRKEFKKLLNDDKNREFVDRIYYEMAIFEIKHSNPDLAVDYLKSSVAVSENNPRQKGMAYLKLGELYYDLYKNYPLAQAYYDSTVNVLPQNEERYPEIKLRSEILTDFVEQIQTIHLQDSLLALSDISSSELQQLLGDVIAEQDQKEKEQQREAQRKAMRANPGSGNHMYGNSMGSGFGLDNDNPAEGDTWYFYMLTAVSTGRSQFLTKWGNRPLEDNWRRSQKLATSTFTTTETSIAQDTSNIAEITDQEAPQLEERVAALMENIPFSAEEKASANKKISDAYFKLGNIYNFQLEEKENAIEIFEKLLSRYPGSEQEAEVFYLLFLINKSSNPADSESYKQKLIDKYPDSIYAKLAINPNYEEESNETAQRLQKLYKIAYDYYRQAQYQQAKLLVSRGLQQYPDNAFSDHLRLLGILIDGKVEGQYKYQYELQQFVENNPESSLVDYANSLLAASKDFKTKELQRKGAEYFTYFDQPHFFVFVYPNLGGFTELIPGLIENFINEKYAGQNLKIGNLSLNEGFSMVLINKFATMEKAMNFYDDFNKSDIKLPNDEKISFENFIITEDNFQIFFQTKKTEDYLTFFDKYYIQQ